MEQPEDYNVIHVGEELHAVDATVFKQARKSKMISVASFCSLGFMVFVLVFVNASFNTSLEKQERQISSLIDEMGRLSQANFQLSQQVISQESVLQSIEGNFASLSEAIKVGSIDEVSSSFTAILASLDSSETDLDISTFVPAETVEDSTFDVLVLGTNGSHTDTIMVASINEEKQKISLFSIPRDLYINGRRINEYYTYYGVDQLSRMVSTVTGLQMDRYVQVDLDGFVEIVDILGGLDLYVPETIYDGLYPNGNGGYSAYSIEQGQHHMDGEEALRYARSRKSTSDFDRAERQQIILAALKTKAVQLDSVMEMKGLTAVFQSGMEHTTSNIDLLELLGFYYDYQSYDLNTGLVLTSGNYLNSLINESGAYILLPRVKDYSEIHTVISDLVN